MNTTVSKRSYFSYAILNAITFGIYGVVVRGQVANDIEVICAGDGQQPQKSFGQAWITSKLYNLLVFGIVGLPLAIAAGIGGSYIGSELRYYTDLPINGFTMFLLVILLTVILAFIFEGPYLGSWWYTQHNRLVLNSHRFKMVLNDNAFDTAVWKSIMFTPMNLFSFLGYALCLAGFVGFIALASYHMVAFAILSLVGGYLLGAIALFLKNIINLPFYYTLKSINRFAENMGISYAGPYDPMGLLDEDNKDNIFSRTINVLNNFGKEDAPKASRKVEEDDDSKTRIDLTPKPGTGVFDPSNIKHPTPDAGGSIECIAGTNRGYVYNISDGEELIIGKDPKTASIVISPEYKDVSRKHCGIKYSVSAGAYIVTDYSSNGTKVNGVKMESGKAQTVRRGSQIALGKGDNIFKVK